MPSEGLFAASLRYMINKQVQHEPLGNKVD